MLFASQDLTKAMTRMKLGSQADAESIRAFFDNMALPLPRAGQYMDTRDVGGHNDLGKKDGLAVFLNRSGLALRILSNATHDHILLTTGNDKVVQPLKMVKLERCAFAIVPGVRIIPHAYAKWGLEQFSPEDQIIANFLYEDSDGKPFIFNDISCANNVGVLPAQWNIGGEMRPFPAVLDYGCILKRHDQKGQLSRSFAKAAYEGIQERAFAPVREALLEAWPDDGPPSPQGMQRFFKLCAAIVDRPENDPQRLLVPGWNLKDQPIDKTRLASTCAASYQQAIDTPPRPGAFSFLRFG